MISAAILAGGTASRFNGIIKSKIVIEGEMIISRILSVLNDIFQEIFIVTNPITRFEEFTACILIQDEILNTGPLGGIHAALKASSGNAVFVIAGDMPFPDMRLITRMIRIYEEEAPDALVPVVGEYSEPLFSIYNTSLIQHIENFLSQNNEIAVADFLKTVNVRYLAFEKSPEVQKAFTNINSPEDLNRFN